MELFNQESRINNRDNQSCSTLEVHRDGARLVDGDRKGRLAARRVPNLAHKRQLREVRTPGPLDLSIFQGKLGTVRGTGDASAGNFALAAGRSA